MKRPIDKTIILIVITGFALGCGKKEKVAGDAPQASQQETTGITLSEAQAAAAGIDLGSIERREVFEKVRANGYFDAPPQNKAQVTTFYPGYVKNTSLLIGDVVKKGQVIAVLENPEYIKLQQNFMKINGQLGYLKSEYDRKRVLEAENIASKKDLLKAEADYKAALAQYMGLKEELQMMGFSINQVMKGKYSSSLAIKAPIAGTVTGVNMVIGKYVRPGEVILEIVDTDHLHVELNVFEKDVLKVAEGQTILLRIPSLIDKTYEGEIYLVGKAFEEEKRTVNVHGHLKDEHPEFIPGAYIEAEILVKSVTIDALPEEAVVEIAGNAYIFTGMEKDENGRKYQRVRVETGLKTDGWVEIKNPDKEVLNGNVVVEGVYFLSSHFEEKGGH